VTSSTRRRYSLTVTDDAGRLRGCWLPSKTWLPTLATTYRFANGDVCLSTTLTTSGYLHLLTVRKNVPFTMLAYYVDYAYTSIYTMRWLSAAVVQMLLRNHRAWQCRSFYRCWAKLSRSTDVMNCCSPRGAWRQEPPGGLGQNAPILERPTFSLPT